MARPRAPGPGRCAASGVFCRAVGARRAAGRRHADAYASVVVAWKEAGLDRTPYRVVSNPARVYLGRRKRWRKERYTVYCGGRMTGQFVLRQIKEAGCQPGPVRQQGSHVRVECEAGRCRTTVPVHRGQDLPAGTLRAIERDLEPCLGRRWLQGRGR